MQDKVAHKYRSIYAEAKILIVDDQEANLRLLQAILSGAGYTNIVVTADSREVSQICAMLQPDLILLDLMMPYLDGFQVMRQLAPTFPNGTYLPILVLTADVAPEARKQALSLGAKDFLTKPLDHVEVLLRINNLLETRFLYLELQGQNEALEKKMQERTSELEQAQFEILERLTVAAEYRDDETGQHTRRVGYLSTLLARASGLPQQEAELIERVAPLHDLGKIGIPDDVLLKPAKLTPYEFEVMKTHTIIGARILSGGHSDMVKMAQTIALTHHERWDGTGYPHRLQGESIPKVGRIVALADTFDALTHKRPYKDAWPVDEAIEEVRRQRAKQFDPHLVDIFLHMDVQTLKPPVDTLADLSGPGFTSLPDFLHSCIATTWAGPAKDMLIPRGSVDGAA
ncbi:MAG TPA: HD domain-containing phosphohydrolase [Chloroflexia bacterium]|jgi:putative two-component system response regulator